MYPSLPKFYMLEPSQHLIIRENDNLKLERSWFGFRV